MAVSSSWAQGQRHLPVGRAVAAEPLPGADQAAVGLGGEQPVAEIRGDLGGCRSAGRHGYRRELARRVEHAGVLELEVLALVEAVPALPQQADDLQCLAEPLVADLAAGEAGAGDVLVESFPAPAPRVKRPSEMMARVAAAWAMMAGW